MADFLIQLIGFIGTLCFVISFQLKSSRSLLFIQTIGVFAFIIQFSLLGGITGCLGLALAAVRNILLQQSERFPWIKTNAAKLVFFTISTLSTILTWSSIYSILPWIAFTAGIFSYWKDDAGLIRLANLFFISPSWLTYDLLIHSYGGVLNETLIILSILLYYFRHGWKETKKQSVPD